MLTPLLGAAEPMTLLPRCVLVERPTEFRELLARHGTREQARFFLGQRGLAIEDVEERHLKYEETRARVIGAIPPAWRTAVVERGDLDRFLFAADDIVVVVGQDGLVANVAKYLVRPAHRRQPGAAAVSRRSRAPPSRGDADLCADLAAGRATWSSSAMVRER